MYAGVQYCRWFLNLCNTMSDAVYHVVRCHITADCNFHNHRRANLPFTHTQFESAGRAIARWYRFALNLREN